MSAPEIIPEYWGEAKQHLSSVDPVMADLISTYEGEALKARGAAFYTMARSIVGQQISVKAADSVWEKLIRHLERSDSEAERSQREAGDPSTTALHGSDSAQNDGTMVSRLEKLTDEQLRRCGLSAQKVRYLRAVAEYFRQPPDFRAMSDEEILASLISITGVGEWTAQMFMMFHLLKPDVLPLGDIGLLKGIGVHYGDGKTKVDKATAERIAKPWAPYRSVATWYLWRSLDPVPVEY